MDFLKASCYLQMRVSDTFASRLMCEDNGFLDLMRERCIRKFQGCIVEEPWPANRVLPTDEEDTGLGRS